MTGHRLAMLGGGLWQIVRFGAVLFLVLRILPEQIPMFHVNLIWVGGGSLLLSGIFVANGLKRSLERAYLPILSIGMLLNVVSDIAIALTGSFRTIDERLGMGGVRIARLVFVIMIGILTVDLLILGTLISYRGGARSGRTETETRQLPDVDTTDLEEK